jgi:hypothetical protein
MLSCKWERSNDYSSTLVTKIPVNPVDIEVSSRKIVLSQNSREMILISSSVVHLFLVSVDAFLPEAICPTASLKENQPPSSMNQLTK